MCVSADDGGYPGIWRSGLPSVLGLEVKALPFSKVRMNIQVDKALETIIEVKPQVIIFGASHFLFLHPINELTEVARSIGAHIGFDGSHVMGLIAGGKFQSPLQEGSPTLFGSTHNSFFGPRRNYTCG